MKVERYDRIRTFDGLEGLNNILYGEKAIAHKDEFVSHAIHELSMRPGATGYARYGSIYGWYNTRADGSPWVDFIPPEPGRFDGNDLPTENEVKKGD